VSILSSGEKRIEWVTVSLLTHRTIEPALTVICAGLNAIFWIMIVLAKTDGVVGIAEVGADTTETGDVVPGDEAPAGCPS
jgi:hypothetical protein